jgi:hypothetical protein
MKACCQALLVLILLGANLLVPSGGVSDCRACCDEVRAACCCLEPFQPDASRQPVIPAPASSARQLLIAVWEQVSVCFQLLDQPERAVATPTGASGFASVPLFLRNCLFLI